MVEEHAHGGAGDEGGEPLEKFDELERKWEEPSRQTVLSFDADAVVGVEAKAILSERGAEMR